MKIKIELTEEQQTWLLRFFNHEWNEEIEYQERNMEPDTSYLEDMLEVYEALLGKTSNIFVAMANQEDIEDKKKDIENLKEEND